MTALAIIAALFVAYQLGRLRERRHIAALLADHLAGRSRSVNSDIT
jgi:hypothetical protein